MKRRIVLDTNVIISTLVFGGKPQIIYEFIIFNKLIEAYSSENALSELLRVLKLKFEYDIDQLRLVEYNFRKIFKIILVSKIPNIINVDPTDNEFLAIAVASGADVIISGDRHLLNLKKYKNIKIVTPTKFLEDFLE